MKKNALIDTQLPSLQASVQLLGELISSASTRGALEDSQHTLKLLAYLKARCLVGTLKKKAFFKAKLDCCKFVTPIGNKGVWCHTQIAMWHILAGHVSCLICRNFSDFLHRMPMELPRRRVQSS